MIRGNSLARRVVGIFLRNPRALHTVLREQFRVALGIDLDRRFRSGFSGLPTNLSINITRRCNLNCLMCNQHRHGKVIPSGLSWYNPDHELPLSAWIDLLDQATAFRPSIYITGGEPLLYPEIGNFILEAKKRKFMVHVQTNGTLLKQKADELVQTRVDFVTVSVDGSEEVHDHIRGRKGTYKRTLEGINALREAKTRIGKPNPILKMNCVISKENLGVMHEIVRLANEIEVDILQIQHTIFSSPKHVHAHNQILSPDWARENDIEMFFPSIPEGEYYSSLLEPQDLPHLLSGLKQAREQSGPHLKLVYLPDLPEELLEPYYLDLDHPFPQQCNALWKTCRIMPDGSVSPCLHINAGNIANKTLQEIWNGRVMRQFRKTISNGLLPGCARCCYRSFIGG